MATTCRFLIIIWFSKYLIMLVFSFRCRISKIGFFKLFKLFKHIRHVISVDPGTMLQYRYSKSPVMTEWRLLGDVVYLA